jgi:hypothetical protein
MPMRGINVCLPLIVISSLLRPDSKSYAVEQPILLDFESLQLGDLEGQGGWLPPVGPNEYEVISTSSSGYYIGGKAVQPNGGTSVPFWEPNDGGYRAEAVATYQLDSPVTSSPSQPIAVSFDVLFAGRQSIWVWLSDSRGTSISSPAFGIGTYGSYTYRYGRGRAYLNAYDRYIDLTPGDWLRLTMTLDPVAQSFRGREDNLTTGQLDRRTGLQESDGRTLGEIFNTPPFDPRKWDQINIGWRNGGMYVDNIRVFPIPEPSTVALLYIGAIYLLGRRASKWQSRCSIKTVR